ncbi:hypothetical protein Bca52824_059536 [Brassica carinata]|uniref:Uncharacterized protein n=1 Tax=Brassica carinata TaxID=52824 RepID=A0A8X7UIA9_BRACI|nr:hypothetical protein Bca52824_059536 [Brassica carinata]
MKNIVIVSKKEPQAFSHSPKSSSTWCLFRLPRTNSLSLILCLLRYRLPQNRRLQSFVRNRLRRIPIYEFVFSIKTYNEVNNIEGKAVATGKDSSEEEGSKDLENKETLTTIVSTLENISRKFDQIDSRFDAYELERNRPLMDKKTIDDMVKALVEERLKVLGKIPKNYDNLSNGGEEESLPSPQQNTQQKSVNSPVLVGETPGKDTWVAHFIMCLNFLLLLSGWLSF